MKLHSYTNALNLGSGHLSELQTSYLCVENTDSQADLLEACAGTVILCCSTDEKISRFHVESIGGAGRSVSTVVSSLQLNRNPRTVYWCKTITPKGICEESRKLVGELQPFFWCQEMWSTLSPDVGGRPPVATISAD
jgi:hypothetical protein